MAAKNRVGRSEFFFILVRQCITVSNGLPTKQSKFRQISAAIYKNSIKFLGSAGKN